MIYWKDFILDDVCGAILDCRDGHLGQPSVKDDAMRAFNQETRQVNDATFASNTGCVRAEVQGETNLENNMDAPAWMESGGLDPLPSRLRGAG